jgi:hypothetical protein
VLDWQINLEALKKIFRSEAGSNEEVNENTWKKMTITKTTPVASKLVMFGKFWR